MLEKFSQVFEVGLLPKGLLEKLGHFNRILFGHLSYLRPCLSVMNKQHKHVLELVVYGRAYIFVGLEKEFFRVLCQRFIDPVIISSFEHVLVLGFEVAPEGSQNLFYKNVSLDSILGHFPKNISRRYLYQILITFRGLTFWVFKIF